jgi:hypothetical protein
VQSPRAPAVAPNVAPSPRPPAVAAPASPARWEDEPASDSWENAPTVNSFPEPDDLPAPTPRVLPAAQAASPARQASPATQGVTAIATAAPATPASPGTMRGPYPTAPGIGDGAPLVASPPLPPPAPAAPGGRPAVAGPTGAARGATASPATAGTAGLGSAMREEVWAIVRAAVEEAMGPLVARQREFEARVERAERGASGTAATLLQSISPMGGPSSIPVAFGPSLAPPAFTAKAPPRLPSFDNEPSSGTNPGGTTIPDLKAAPAYQSGGGVAAQPARGPMLSLPPQGYGVTVMQSTRPKLDLDAVGPVDVDGFDGGQRKRRVGYAVVVIMLMIIIGVVTMTVLSHG